MSLLRIYPNILSTAAPATLALSGAVGAAVLLLLREIRSWWRLRHVPGPFWHAFSMYPMIKLTQTGRLSAILKDYGEEYGPLVRVGPNEVMFGDADTYRSISGVRSSFTKGPWYELSRMIPDQDSLFSMRDEAGRKELRAKLTPGYSGREGASFEPGVDKHVQMLVNLIERKYLSTPSDFRPIEFSHKSQYFALDVISYLGFGEAIGFLKNDSDMHHYVESNDAFFPVLAVVLNMPWLDRWLRMWPLSLALPKVGDEAGFGGLMGFAMNLVDKRLAPGAEPGDDMMQAHIRQGLTHKELAAEVFLEMIAGSDSTATAIRMTLLCLLNTPASLSRLRAEVDAAEAAGRISSPVIRDREAYELPYLQAVIKEGLRMFPPSTGHNYKEVPPGGARVCGYDLPGGTQVGVNIMRMMRDKDTFGGDADVFRPERWLDGTKDAEELHDMAATVELAFGHGKFQCLGKTIAAMELNKVIVELVRRFDFAVVNPPFPLRLWDAAFWVTNDFWLRVTPRA
ncbi:cytochrome P450 [Stachybotrys elegans]|uniref:Cytochrome P450 n=1 Tax=Stachybotrys elegans TaxID=80388 RepID=A0A8K0STA4_9HYPO|nr:cytochrome P450 [Stachybotrys elegans]